MCTEKEIDLSKDLTVNDLSPIWLRASLISEGIGSDFSSISSIFNRFTSIINLVAIDYRY